MVIDPNLSTFFDEQPILFVLLTHRNPAYPACLHLTSLVSASLASAALSSYMFCLPVFLQDKVLTLRQATHPLVTAPAPRGCFYADPADRLLSLELGTRGSRAAYILDVPARRPLACPGTPGARVTVVPSASEQ
ncbi:hypothetical protein BV25DRAFT_763526 [Artomyces pyxidatus]|uniref:Uncharacterized protein n=1 Tax=Artomyces pyxidatus TaxID=48021 RepID=A0ACB8T081_9AGAM|nr:hypothetical protein BV25DRAFT_763526 [Artomyces pyxidatus]